MRRRAAFAFLALVAWVAGAALGAVAPVGPDAALAQSSPTPGVVIGKAHAGYVPVLDSTTPIFILFIGSGARPGDDVTHSLADSIHLVGINPAKHRASILGIPRDSWVPIPGHGTNKINAAMVDGGPGLLVQTVEAITGIKIDYWVLTTFWGFQGMIDAIGRLTVDVPFAMHDHYSRADFQPGVRKFNGRDALAFARDRHSLPSGDFGRSEDAGRLMLASLTQFRKEFAKDPSRLLTWVGAGMRNVQTTVPLEQVLALAFTASTINPKHVQNIVVPGSDSMVGSESIVNLSPGASAIYRDMKNDAIVSKNNVPPSPNAQLLH